MVLQRADFIRKIQQAQQAQSNWTASESETPAAAAPDPSFGSQLDGCSESVFLYFCDAFGFDVTPYGMQPLHDSLIVKVYIYQYCQLCAFSCCQAVYT